jgi:membrane associated rhomboid family serine protease|tara:strand:- start:7008 stop:7682 length:675 start_codon:yes stop_codon:yes gene_type:complete
MFTFAVQQYSPMSTIPLVIIILNALVSFKGFNDRAFFDQYKFQIGPLQAGERIRLLSSAFLHADVSHLLFNMLTLYFFADVVLYGVGPIYFVLIYIASLFGGNWYALQRHRNEPYYSAVGASGAVMGVLYAAIMLQPHMGLYMFFIPIAIPAWLFGIMYLLYSIYGMKRQLGSIGHDAHIGGAVVGYALILLARPELLATDLWLVVLMALPIVALYFLEKKGKV